MLSRMPQAHPSPSPRISPSLLHQYRAAQWHSFRAHALLHPVGQLLHLLLCLLSPLGALGLWLPGLLTTALFAATLSGLALWGNIATAEKLLLWWSGWGVLVWGGSFLLRLLIAWQLWKKRRRPLPPSEDAEHGQPESRELSPLWQKQEDGWETSLSLSTRTCGLCVLELTTEDCESEPDPDSAGLSACHAEGIPGLRRRYLLFFQLEPGTHRLPLRLKGNQPQPPNAKLRLLHPAREEEAGFCHLP